MYLVRAPVPGGQYGEPQSHAGPGQVSSDSVSEQVHGILTWQVAGTVGNDLTGHRHAVHTLQIAVAANLVESCGPGSHNSSYTILKITAVVVCLFSMITVQTSDC